MADGIENVLDPHWKPRTKEEADLDLAHNKFFMTVLEHTLQLDIGKTTIRKYEAKNDLFNARGVYAKLTVKLQKNVKG